MKKIFSLTLAALAFMTIMSCEKKMDNSEFSEWLGQNYNQECLWNMDSIAFRRADWQKTELQKGAALNSAKIKMLGSYQSVKYLTYGADAFATNVAAPESGVKKISESVGAKTIFAMNGGPFTSAGASSYLKIDGDVKNNTSATTGLGFTIGADGGVVSVLQDGSLSEYETAIGGATILLIDGVEQQVASSPENDARVARSIFGVTKDGKNVMAVIEGGIAGQAEGCTMAEAAFMARIIGMHNAVALASGDAATMWIGGPGTVTTTPTGENAVGNYIYTEILTLYDDGELGTKESPYIIKNKRQLTNMHYVVEPEKELWFELAADVDLKGVNWEPLNYDQGFTRKIHFDGKGHTIKNFYTDFANYPSFFGVLNGECKNVKFENAKIESSTNTSGVIGAYIGTTGISGHVENCHIQGDIHQTGAKKDRGFAGIGGMVVGSTIKNCYVDVNISSPYPSNVNEGVGGVAGELNSSHVENCFVAGKIDAVQFNVGGVVGRANTSGPCTVKGCISWMSKIVGRAAAGKIVGRWNTKKIGANSVQSDNYSLETSQMITYQNDGNPYADDFLYGNGENGGGADYCIMGTAAKNAVESAKAIGWDETIWDLSGATPQLKLFKK